MTEVEKLYRFFWILALIGIAVAVGGFFGSIISKQAFRRGRTGRQWFWLGFFFNVFALAALYIMEPGPGAQIRRRRSYSEFVRHPLQRRERVWGESGSYRSDPRRRISNGAVILAFGAAGLVVGGLWLGWTPVTTVAGILVGITVLAIASILRDRSVTPDKEPDPDRPETPSRAVAQVPGLLLAIAGFWFSGFFADLLWGVVWGAIATAALLGALFLAERRFDPWTTAVLAAGVTVSTILSRVVVPDTPERLTANLSLLMAVAWLPAAAAAGATVWHRTHSPARATTTALGWAGAAMMALPAAVSFGILKPLEYVVGEPDPFGTATFALLGLIVGLVGGAFLLSGVTGLNSLATGATILFLSVYTAGQVGFTIPGLVRNFTNMSEVAEKMWPPDFDWAIGTGSWWNIASWDFGSELRANPLLQTFQIAIIACLVGVTLAIPLAFRASKITSIRGSDYWLNKGFMNTIRTIPDLFWAMVFATSVGIGPFAGTLALIFFSIAIMSKLLSETIDAVDPRPIEAARATGSHHWPAMRTAVWPQVLPNYVAYALYIFEINIRASVVLGIVGAGGIGRVLEAQRAFFRFDRVLAIVIVIFVIVFLIEQVSVALRRRLV